MNDPQNIVGRLTSLLPRGWLPDVAPAASVPLSGAAQLWDEIFALLAYVKEQTRITTAGDVFLDLAARDYLGVRVGRKPGQTDDSFRARIKVEVLRPRATRAALISAITDLTGISPGVFEPRWPPDTGGYGNIGMSLGTALAYGGASGGGAGGWGSLALPFQFFVTAYTGNSQFGGIGGIGGFYYGTGWAGGGYGSLTNNAAGAGSIEYLSAEQSTNVIDAADIDQLIVSMIPVGTIAWTKVMDYAPPGGSTTPILPPTPEGPPPAAPDPFSSFFDSEFGGP